MMESSKLPPSESAEKGLTFTSGLLADFEEK